MFGECRARNKEESIRNVAKKMSVVIVMRGAKELEFIEFFSDCVFEVQENKSRMCSSKIFTT